ncbi:MAG: hypothetical protein ACI4WM_01540 [Erysipelotrichaceae bacterium]
MKLNKEMIRSVEEELSRAAGRELSDDFLDNVSGGRDMYDIEESITLDMVMEKSRYYMNGTMSQEKYFSFLQAVENYRDYIALLPDDSDIVMFSYDRFKDGVFQ